jgi:hypothetical protein
MKTSTPTPALKRYKYRLLMHTSGTRVGLIRAKDDVEFMKALVERYKAETISVLSKNYYRITIPQFETVANQQVRTHVNRCHVSCEVI